MRSAEVYRNGILAGKLTETNHQSFEFTYEEKYFNTLTEPAISLTIPKDKRVYTSNYLFPFFYNMLSEGENKKLQCRHLRIDEADDFGLLMATAQYDTIGAVTIKPITG